MTTFEWRSYHTRRANALLEDPEVARRILDAVYNSPASYREIAECMREDGVEANPISVQYAAEMLGAPRRPRGTARHTVSQMIEGARMYWRLVAAGDPAPAGEVANEYGITRRTARRWALKWRTYL